MINFRWIIRVDKNEINNFLETILSVFNKYAPIKKKNFRANEAPLLTQNLHKEIIKRLS